MKISNFKFQISTSKRKAVFFDRDGVLNVDHGYVYKKGDWQWTLHAMECIKWCNDNDYLVIVVTNQSGVARGYYTEADVCALHEWVNEQLRANNARIDAFYYCPHYPDGDIAEYAIDCDCRKPRPGMLLRAIADFNIDASKSVMFGDKASDLEAAAAAGVDGILVARNAGWPEISRFVFQIARAGTEFNSDTNLNVL